MVVKNSLQLLQFAVLARLLSPEDFGLMAMMAVVIGYAKSYADMGISKAIIHRQDVAGDQLSSLYWLSILAGFVAFALVWLSTPLVVGFFNEPRLADLMFWMALTFLITPIGQQFRILMQRDLEFDRIAKVEVGSTTTGVAVSILLAVAGHGVYSLIWGQLAVYSIRAALFVWQGLHIWHPRLHFKRRDLDGFVSFGLYRMGERSVNYFSANVDYLIIGRFLGPEILGIYRLAYELVLRPLQSINPVINRVAFPIFAKKQSDDAALRRGYLEVIKALSLVVFPILIGLAVLAPLIVPLIFGDQWIAAVPFVQILALLGMLKAVANPIGTILLAKGRVDIGFKWNVFVAVANTLVFLSVVRFGALAVAWAYVGLSVLYSIPIWFILYSVIRLDYRSYIAVLRTPAILGALMGLTVYASYLLLVERVSSRPVLLAGLVAIGVSVYGLSCLVSQRSYFRELWLLLHRRKPELA